MSPNAAKCAVLSDTPIGGSPFRIEPMMKMYTT
jgi:hypothetical protein